MATFDAILTCSVGTSSFQLAGYDKSADGLYDDQAARYATQVRFQCRGYLEAADAAALAAAIAAFEADCASQEGQDFSISAQGAVKEQVLAADCLDGPHVSFAYDSPDGGAQGPITQHASVTVTALKTRDPDLDGVLSETESLKVDIDVEGLQTLTISGRVRTAEATSASERFLAAHLPEAPTGYQQHYRYEADERDVLCAYEVVQRELVALYPSSPGGAILAGERTVDVDYDEHNRKVTVYTYDYTGPGAEDYVAQRHTALRASGALRRASVTSQTHQTRHVVGRFELLFGRDGSPLLELAETVTAAGSGPLLRECRYAGTTPLIVQDAEPAYLYTQSGRAVGFCQYPTPPAYLFDEEHLADRPEVTQHRLDDCEYETAWRFTFLFAEGQVVPEPHGRADCGPAGSV